MCERLWIEFLWYREAASQFKVLENESECVCKIDPNQATNEARKDEGSGARGAGQEQPQAAVAGRPDLLMAENSSCDRHGKIGRRRAGVSAKPIAEGEEQQGFEAWARHREMWGGLQGSLEFSPNPEQLFVPDSCTSFSTRICSLPRHHRRAAASCHT